MLLGHWWYIWTHQVGLCECLKFSARHTNREGVRREADTGRVRVTHLNPKITGSLKYQNYGRRPVYTPEQRREKMRVKARERYTNPLVKAKKKEYDKKRYALVGDERRRKSRERYARNRDKMRAIQRAKYWRKRALQKEAAQKEAVHLADKGKLVALGKEEKG
jgi:hypothetical protein